MLELVKEWIVHYGYAALYGLLAVGIIGLPVPDEILMAFVGYLCSIGWFVFLWAWLVCFTGSLTGMSLSYWIGHKVGKPFLQKYGRWVKLTPERLQKAEGWFHRFGMWTVTFGYFVPGVRHFTCYWAGVSGVKLLRYLVFAALGAILWCSTFLLIGFFLGDSVGDVLLALHRYMGAGLLGVLFVAAGIGSVVLVMKRKGHVGS